MKPGSTAAQSGLILCEACGLLVRPAHANEPGYCPRCDAELEFRRHDSIQRTWALIIGAAICYLPANILPVMISSGLGTVEEDTIISGVILLYNTGSWPLALMVLIASVMIPLAKLIALSYLLITVQRGSIRKNRDRARLYRLVEIVGTLVDAGRVRGHLYRGPHPAPALDGGAARDRGAVLWGGGGSDNAGGRILRPPADLGFQ